MKLSEMIEGLQILQKYYNTDRNCMGVSEDEFFLYITDVPMSSDDVERMFELGWHQSDVNPNTVIESYDPEMLWSAVV